MRRRYRLWPLWVRHWRQIVAVLKRSPESASIVAKRATASLAIVDVQVARGREDALHAIVREIMQLLPRAREHIGKSVAAPTRAFSSATGYNVTRTSPAQCYHPYCARDGTTREYVSVRGRQTQWIL